MYANNDISLAIEFIKKPMVLMPSVFLQEIKGSEILLQYKYDIFTGMGKDLIKSWVSCSLIYSSIR